MRLQSAKLPILAMEKPRLQLESRVISVRQNVILPARDYDVFIIQSTAGPNPNGETSECLKLKAVF